MSERSTISTTELRLPAPAKLNLFLHILGRRDDGYHQLQTVFQLLDFGDELLLRTRADGQIRLTPELAGVPVRQNLIWRAADALRQATGCTLGADIHLTKRLPMGGGLGGGSSNAATALVGLNRLWRTGLDTEALIRMGRNLGADVPIFIRGDSAWAEGIGDLLTPVELPERWFVVLIPDCHVSTANIFQHRELTRDTLPITIRAFLGGGGNNDCQPVVEKLHPEVLAARRWLQQYGPSRMTGTGACVFAPFDTQAEAESILAQRPDHLDGFVARGVNRSPLHCKLPSPEQ